MDIASRAWGMVASVQGLSFLYINIETITLEMATKIFRDVAFVASLCLKSEFFECAGCGPAFLEPWVAQVR
ncbi:hypothetical protein [Halotalea alkalilenta]|uniref:hypothetical protein n=1 Tax=Halotalea alkalilenta TaxID=376489 RepID=UPI0012DEB6C2|nr:hypothetical protein [Halotalea alkalilenta]